MRSDLLSLRPLHITGTLYFTKENDSSKSKFNMKLKFLVIAIFLTVISCSKKLVKVDSSKTEIEEPQEEFDSFWAQSTINSEYNIFQYSISGNYKKKETRIIKATDEFSTLKGLNISEYEIGHWISQDTLLLYNYISKSGQPKDTLPENIEYKNFEDIVLRVETFRTNSWGRNPLKFKSYTIKENEIKIHGISHKLFKETETFPLGATFFRMEGKKLNRIDINTLDRNMMFVYKQPDGEFKGGLPGVGITIFEFTPEEDLLVEKSNNGIFYNKLLNTQK